MAAGRRALRDEHRPLHPLDALEAHGPGQPALRAGVRAAPAVPGGPGREHARGREAGPGAGG
ncbi:hypothetical protein D7V77_41935 [Corallococcus sp. CA041A]|nr:hypothetical protein D7V77_41935 [Corallococcus sp. CA041A]